MSWFSRAENALFNLIAGKPAQTNIILKPTTSVEAAINNAAAKVLPIAAKVPGVNVLAVPLEAVKAAVNGTETAISATESTIASGVVGELTGLIGTEAAKLVNGFLTSTIGTQSAEMMDAAMEAVATAALTMMSQSKNKTVDEIAAALHVLVTSFEAATAATAAANLAKAA